MTDTARSIRTASAVRRAPAQNDGIEAALSAAQFEARNLERLRGQAQSAIDAVTGGLMIIAGRKRMRDKPMSVVDELGVPMHRPTPKRFGEQWTPERYFQAVIDQHGAGARLWIEFTERATLIDERTGREQVAEPGDLATTTAAEALTFARAKCAVPTFLGSEAA